MALVSQHMPCIASACVLSFDACCCSSIGSLEFELQNLLIKVSPILYSTLMSEISIHLKTSVTQFASWEDVVFSSCLLDCLV